MDSIRRLDHTMICCFSSFTSLHICILWNDCMPLFFRGFSVFMREDFMIVFSFCQLITFYIKKHSCQLISWVQGTLWQLLLFFYFIFWSTPLINYKRRRPICGFQKMYLIPRQLWDGSVADRRGSWEQGRARPQTPGRLGWFVWYSERRKKRW